MAIRQGINTTRIIMQIMAACVFVVLLGMGKPVSGREIYVVILNDLPGEMQICVFNMWYCKHEGDQVGISVVVRMHIL
ncbi:unnamed protein product [Sphagnum jensenii]|uniref:Uncharacterized protein n=1 Tax=Sphagnum jensenii TaxID=128206 RepID=A0ABP1B2N4_9BRYO